MPGGSRSGSRRESERTPERWNSSPARGPLRSRFPRQRRRSDRVRANRSGRFPARMRGSADHAIHDRTLMLLRRAWADERTTVDKHSRLNGAHRCGPPRTDADALDDLQRRMALSPGTGRSVNRGLGLGRRSAACGLLAGSCSKPVTRELPWTADLEGDTLEWRRQSTLRIGDGRT